jgi:hypothetical protein
MYNDSILQIYHRFSEAAKLKGVWWLEISGKIHNMMLTPNLTYGVYMVFKLARGGARI